MKRDVRSEISAALNSILFGESGGVGCCCEERPEVRDDDFLGVRFSREEGWRFWCVEEDEEESGGSVQGGERGAVYFPGTTR